MAVQTQILHRRGTAATWTSTNPTLGAGEVGFETDTGKFKIGTGSAAWTALPYAAIDAALLAAKGDLVTATANDTPAVLTVGSNGQDLVADSSTATGLRWRDNFAAGKNAIINGDFAINTRNFTSVTTDVTYTFDRFRLQTIDGTVTVTPQTFTPGAAPVTGYEGSKFAQIAVTGQTAVTASAQYNQAIENVRTFAGQTVTISFWAKATSGTPKIAVEVRQLFGTGGSSIVNTYAGQVTLSTSWVRQSVTVAIPSISGKTIGTDSSLVLNLWLSAGSNFDSRTGTLGIQNNTFQVWGIQLEPGSVATAFETATGNYNSEVVASGAISDGVLVSLNASTNPSGSGSNAWAGYQVAGKNKVINGDFSIWQRGTSIAGTASTTNYVSDRWVGYRVGATFSRQATSDTTNLPNIQYSARAQRDSGNTAVGKIFLTSSIESVNSIPFAGKTVTFSFYARRGANYSSASNLLTSYFVSGTGTDQNILAGFTGSTSFVSDVTLTTTWQRFTITGNVPTTATQLGVGFEYTPSGTAGANDWFEVTGVQLEAGSVATPFTTATGTIQGELAACQRYYWRFQRDVANYNLITNSGYASTTSVARFGVALPVAMRVYPTTIETGNIAANRASTDVRYTTGTWAIGGLGSSTAGNTLCEVVYTHGSGVFTQGEVVNIQSNNVTTQYLALGAEL